MSEAGISAWQSDFTAALMDSASHVPSGLIDPQGRAANKRFDIYRNNVAVSLTEALETAFPVIRKLVGDEFFKAMAGIFLRTHLPSSPLLMFYGQEMPDFLAQFEPAKPLRYLPDIARLELALRHNYHAADAQPIDPGILQQLAPDELMSAQISFAPAMQLVQSEFPIYGIWHANTFDSGEKPQMQGENVLILRPEFDPQVNSISDGAAHFVSALQTGSSLGEAIEAASSAEINFELPNILSTLISGGAITSITSSNSE